MANQTELQLKVLKEIQGICTKLQVDFWLRGGWAIDFNQGIVTREHSDVDLVTLIEHRELLEDALELAKYNKTPISDLQTDFEKEGVDISIVYVVRLNDGQIHASGFPDWIWREDSLQTDPSILLGISIHTLSLGQLLEEKLVYESGTGRKLRPKDYKSIEVLRQMIYDFKS